MRLPLAVFAGVWYNIAYGNREKEFLIMKMQYCMHCGMPVPRRAKICPECGNTMKQSAPQTIVPRFSPEKPGAAGRTHRGTQSVNKSALVVSTVAVVVAVAAISVFMTVADNLKDARSRHRENRTEQQRGTAGHPEISIPEISIPEISVPDLHLPEPPAAEFAAESYEVKTNPAGDTVLYVNLSYTNKAEEQKRFLTNFRISVQQEGELCRQTVGNPENGNGLMSPVQPEETALISEAFIIQAEKEATVSVNALFGKEVIWEETVFPQADGAVSVAE